jgi:hypothetical protein
MPRGDQPARQWKIIQTLITSRRGKSAAELAEDQALQELRPVQGDHQQGQCGHPLQKKRAFEKLKDP